MVAARIPLVSLTPDRVRREMERAEQVEGQARHYRARLARVVGLCVVEWGVGYLLGMSAFRVHGAELGHTLLLAATLVILMVPAWTLLLWHWLEDQQ